MVANPILTDEHGKRIYSSQETDKQPSQIIYESKFLHVDEIKPPGLRALQPPKPSDELPRKEQPGPFFVNMVDRFRLQNRIMGHLKDKFEHDDYESLKRESNVTKHVGSSEAGADHGGGQPVVRQDLIHRDLHPLRVLTRNSSSESRTTRAVTRCSSPRRSSGTRRS